MFINFNGDDDVIQSLHYYICRPSLQPDELHSIAAMKKVRKGTNLHVKIDKYLNNNSLYRYLGIRKINRFGFGFGFGRANMSEIRRNIRKLEALKSM